MKIANLPQNLRRGRYSSRESAFTLIELLVVIAIIGILAGVVLASLNSARIKGRHAAIKSNLRNAVAQAALFFNENGTYTGFCSDPKIVEILTALGGSGNAACYVQINVINDRDWGIGVTFNDVHFIADPAGVIQMDATDNTTGGATQDWQTAKDSCAVVGKRLPSPSGYRALDDIIPTVPPSGFPIGDYWTSLEHPNNATYAYYGRSMTGTWNVSFSAKTTLLRVRCGS